MMGDKASFSNNLSTFGAPERTPCGLSWPSWLALDGLGSKTLSVTSICLRKSEKEETNRFVTHIRKNVFIFCVCLYGPYKEEYFIFVWFFSKW